MTTPSFLLSLILFFSYNRKPAMAWQAAVPSSSVAVSSIRHGGDRRHFLFQIATATATTVTILTVSPQASQAASALTPDAARDQWKRALTTLDELSQNWSTVASSGDAIRIQLGTQGTTSPLFQIDKVLKVLRDDADDFIEFQETADEFQLALARADSMAYSANFAGGSGKPTPPAVYIEKSKTEVAELIRIAKKLNAML